jgi:hypothetical protein
MMITRDMNISELTKLLGKNATELHALNMRFLLISNSYAGKNTEDVPTWVWNAYHLRAIEAS